eukprot:GCRY01002910.1.p1 GENE.GCRY01002910.1~~GCRY01002910.1.p1  ORF type:complete len:530 (+),score=86.87 GCRY01002910.1:343-1932(+)
MGIMAGLDNYHSTEGLISHNEDEVVTFEDTPLFENRIELLKVVPGRNVSFFWVEKCIVVLEFFQYFSVLYILSKFWSWPLWFREKLEWALYISFWFPDSPFVAFQILAVMYIILFGTAGVLQFAKVQSVSRQILIYDVQRWCFFVGVAFSLPLFMAASNTSLCNDDSDLIVDSSVSCNSLVMFFRVALWALTLLMIIVSIWAVRAIATAVMVYGQKDHEHFLQMRELEYLFGLNISWAAQRFFLMSSYRRTHVYYLPYSFALKCCVVVVYTLFRPQTLSDEGHLTLQTILFIALFAAHAVLLILRPPFRCSSSNRLVTTAAVALTIFSILGYFASAGTQSPLLLSDVMATWLMFVTAFVGFISLIVVADALVLKRSWPVTPQRLSTTTNTPTALSLTILYQLMKARETTVRLRSSASLFSEDELLRDMLQQLFVLRARAHSEGSVLLPAVEAMIKDIQHLRADTLALPDRIPLTADLRDLLPPLSARLRERERYFALLGPTASRVVLKLTAVAAFCKKKNEPSIEPDDL